MSTDTPAPRRRLAAPVRLLRRVLAPAGLELEGQLAGLRQELAELRAADAGSRAELAAERERVRELTERCDRLEVGLHEERRLHLRIAELTDLVTELVLPLHDRQIDPAVLRSLRPDTL